MSLNRELYEHAPESVRRVIDRAYEAVYEEFRRAGWPCANDDRAEALVDTLTGYAVTSLPEENWTSPYGPVRALANLAEAAEQCPKRIVVRGRRWFQRSYGNTYHGVNVWAVGNSGDVKPIYKSAVSEYGYGGHYLETAANAVEAVASEYGLPPRQYHDNGSREPLRLWLERAGIELDYSVEDVPRERDLTDW